MGAVLQFVFVSFAFAMVAGVEVIMERWLRPMV